jgi:hypothetical protein
MQNWNQDIRVRNQDKNKKIGSYMIFSTEVNPLSCSVATAFFYYCLNSWFLTLDSYK